MAKKEFIGITYESDRLRLARIRATKAGLELLEVDTIHLPQPILSQREPAPGQQDFSGEYDGIFEAETSPATGLDDLDDLENFDFEEGGEESADLGGLDNDFDMTRPKDISEAAEDNEQMLAQYVAKYSSSKLNIGLHIPFGKTTFQFFKNVDPSKMKKRDRKEFFEEKLRPIFGRDILEEHYSWVKIGENDCLLAYNPNDLELLNLVELAETYSKKKLLVKDRQPDESIWAGLVRTNYNTEADEITGLIALGEKSSRIMFMKGSEIISVLPIITEGEEEENILNTIFSKILFEIDKGEIPKINRMLLVRSAKLSEKALKYFKKQFEDIEVDYFTLHPERFTYSDEIMNSPEYLQPYITAIGAAWAASGENAKEFAGFSLVPEYVLENQRTLKIEWHGIMILALIALTPLFLNNLYNDRSDTLQQLEQQNRLLQTEIDELRPIANMTEDLIQDAMVINGENDRLLELARYSQKWSEVLRTFNNGVADIPGVWLTSLRTSDPHLNISGISLSREQIPVIARLFSDMNINQVTETEIRGQRVYTFAMQANNFRNDINPFLLEMPQHDGQEMDEREIELSFAPDDEFFPEQSFNSEPEEVVQEQTPPAPVEEEVAETVQQQDTPPAVEQTETIADEQQNSDREEDVVEVTEPVQQPEPNVPVLRNGSISSYGLMGYEEITLLGAYTIVLHSLQSYERAVEEMKEFREEGYKTTLWEYRFSDGTTTWRVGVGQFETVSDALSAINDLPEPYRNTNFITRIR
ncbi:MAG: SPOR domain-containing protein [Balneolaceae bacterium]|nr:SPOR domain-containing protein [Balneolaceae bacterium]